MVALRCTQRLLARLPNSPVSVAVEASNRLGHWYANTVVIDRVPHVLAISERSLLSVLLVGAPFATLAERLPLALGQLLRALGVPALVVEREVSAMRPMVIAKTASRQLLGVLNQYTFEVEVHMAYHPEWSLLEHEVKLSESVSSAIRYNDPRGLALELLTAESKH